MVNSLGETNLIFHICIFGSLTSYSLCPSCRWIMWLTWLSYTFLSCYWSLVDNFHVNMWRPLISFNGNCSVFRNRVWLALIWRLYWISFVVFLLRVWLPRACVREYVFGCACICVCVCVSISMMLINIFQLNFIYKYIKFGIVRFLIFPQAFCK